MDRPAFVGAGRTLFSLGLVKGAEGNLSTFDGSVLTITRTGCSLAALGEGDVLEGSLDVPPADASSDLRVHVEHYRRSGPGAVAHAHPAGSVPGSGNSMFSPSSQSGKSSGPRLGSSSRF